MDKKKDANNKNDSEMLVSIFSILESFFVDINISYLHENIEI